VFSSADAPAARVGALRARGVEVETLAGDAPARIAAGLRTLGGRGIQSVLVEGGAALAGALIAAGAVDRVAWFLAPLLIGGDGAPAALAGEGVHELARAPRLMDVASGRVGDDVLVTGRLRPLPRGG
jgi:diaminohydroxyphosphoribosylaminopyrimidine deaminase / 5-amino-6-(5-phosphoribosylamino)uracil reductase